MIQEKKYTMLNRMLVALVRQASNRGTRLAIKYAEVLVLHKQHKLWACCYERAAAHHKQLHACCFIMGALGLH